MFSICLFHKFFFFTWWIVKCFFKPSGCFFWLRKTFLEADVRIHMTTPTQDSTPYRLLPNVWQLYADRTHMDFHMCTVFFSTNVVQLSKKLKKTKKWSHRILCTSVLEWISTGCCSLYLSNNLYSHIERVVCMALPSSDDYEV